MPSRLGTILEMIKWQHTVFALPMALAGAALAIAEAPVRSAGWWVWKLILIIAALAAARFAAMTYNRLVDRDIDASNPRTAERPSVTGEVSPDSMRAFVAVSAAVFVFIAALLNWTAFWLSFPILAVLLGYSHAKRFTALAHLWLGVALGLAPLGAWVAILGRIDDAPIILGIAIVLWVTGFDILYALADIEHDRAEGLHSIPARLGVQRSLGFSRLLHILAVAALLWLGAAAGMGLWFAIGLVAGAVVLAWQHRLVRGHDLSRLPQAFLTCNALFSLAIFLGILLDVASGP